MYDLTGGLRALGTFSDALAALDSECGALVTETDEDGALEAVAAWTFAEAVN